MKSAPRNVLLTFGLAVIALLLFSVRDNHSITGPAPLKVNNLSSAPTGTQQAEASLASQGKPGPSLDEQWTMLTDEVQKNGVAWVDLSLNVPAWDNLMKQTLVPDNQVTESQRDTTLLALSEQARTQLLKDLVSYHCTVIGGMGTYIPSISLKVDKACLYYLKTLSIVKFIDDGSLGGNDLPGD